MTDYAFLTAILRILEYEDSKGDAFGFRCNVPKIYIKESEFWLTAK